MTIKVTSTGKTGYALTTRSKSEVYDRALCVSIKVREYKNTAGRHRKKRILETAIDVILKWLLKIQHIKCRSKWQDCAEKKGKLELQNTCSIRKSTIYRFT